MAEVEDEAGIVPGCLEHALCFAAGDFRGGGQDDGIEVTLHRRTVADALPHATQVDRPVEADDLGTGMHQVGGFMPHPFGVEDDGGATLEFVDDVVDPAQRPGLVVASRADRTPRVEDLHGIRPRIDLHVEIVDDGVAELLHQGLELFGCSKGELLDSGEVLGGSAFEHVAGQRPGRTAKAEQCRVLAQLGAGHTQGIAHVAELLLHSEWIERFDLFRAVERVVHSDSAFIAKMVALSECFWNDEDVRENNRGIEGEAAHWLERHFSSQLRRAHHGEEVVLFFEFAVFRKVAPSLPH